nr:conjugative transposon protein TraN [uncultured Porphyromonas sp.]
MKKVMLMGVLALGMSLGAMAQDNGQSYMLSTGDLYQGMSRAIPAGRVVVPYGLEVSFEKTVHLIFPAPIRYVDLGSNALVAGKADEGGGAENVLRVKAAVRDFERESNLSVICDDGSFYSFNVKYADEPEMLSIEMKDFLSHVDGRLPSNREDIYFKELGSESPMLVKLLMQTIYQNNKREVKHIGAKQFGLRFQMKGLYTHNGLLYFHTQIDNESNMPFGVDFVSFKVVDTKVAKQTAIQERVLQPLRAYHQVMQVRPNGKERTVFALEQFALTEDKQLEVTLYERNGGRRLTFYLQNEDLIRARRIDNLKLMW